jgi:PKHD-type hydroxylase
MLIWLPKLLDASAVARVREFMGRADFVDGKPTAGNLGRAVKENEELDRATPAKREIDALIVETLQRNLMFETAARPKKFTQPIYSRYRPGMQYGRHMDNPVMGHGDGRLRIDMSITIFLSEPESYEGGELVVETEYGPKEAKLPAGDAILYPTVYYHEVRPVTKGERLAAVMWIQSLVKEPFQRNLLYELSVVADWLHKQHPESGPDKQLVKVQMNLLRLWAEN